MDRLLHGRLPIRYGDRLVAIATHFNHAGFVIMARLVTGCVAEVDIDPPDPVAEPTKRRMHNSFYVIGKLLATMDVAVCSNLDQHRRLHGCMRQPRNYRVLLAFQSQRASLTYHWFHEKCGLNLSKIGGNQIIRTSAAANIDPGCCSTYQIAVGIERF
jgi:hypothetical protein